MCLAFAIWLWRVGSPRSVVLKLAVLLVVDGIVLGSSGRAHFYRLGTLLEVPLIAYGILSARVV